jgi:DNA-binding IclR family transcriptional regulator
MVKSAARVADVLNLLGEGRADMTAADIAKELQLPKSSAHGLLNTLLEKGIVTRDRRGNFSLSVRLLTLATRAFDVFDVRQVARPVMMELSAELRLTCSLAVLDRGEVVYIEKVQDNSRPVQLVTYVGGTLPAHATALGKVLVAELAPDAREAWLDQQEYGRLTARTIRDRHGMQAAIERYLKDGYAAEENESHEGVTCVAAPIFDHTGAPVAALSVTGLNLPDTGVLSASGSKGEIGRRVRATADSISALLGYHPTTGAPARR